MADKGCMPTKVTYNVIIDGLCKAGLLDDALKMKKYMVENHLAPDKFTYSALINGCCMKRKFGEAKSILSEMVSV